MTTFAAGDKVGFLTICSVLGGTGKAARFDCRCYCGRSEVVTRHRLVRSTYKACSACTLKMRDAKRRTATDDKYRRKRRQVAGRTPHGPILRCIDCNGPCSKRAKRCDGCNRAFRRGQPLRYPQTLASLGERCGVSETVIRRWAREFGWNETVAKVDALAKTECNDSKGAHKHRPYALSYLLSKGCRVPERKRLRLLAEMGYTSPVARGPGAPA